MRFRTFLLFGILGLGLAVRLIGINFGLPEAIGARPDELVIIRHTLPFGTGDLNPHFFHYPSLWLYLLFILYGLYFLVFKLLGYYQNPSDFACAVLLNPSPLILLARLSSAFFGIFSCYVIYRMFRDKDEIVGLIAGFLFSLTYLSVQQAHFGTTDTAMVGFGILALLFALRVFHYGYTKDYILSGVFAGLAASTKYNGALFLIPLITAFLLRRKNELGSNQLKILFGLLSSVIAFFIGSPFILFDFSTFRNHLLKETSHLLKGATIELGTGWINFLRIGLRYGLGFPFLIFSCLAIIYLFVRRPRLAICLLSFPIIYYLVIGSGKAVYVRHLLPIVPFLGIVSAIFLKDLFSNPAGQIRPIGIVIGSLFILSGSIQNIVGYLKVITQKDTRCQAAEWILKNIEKGSTIGWVGSAWSVPNLPFSQQEIDARFAETRIGIVLPPEIIAKMKTKVKESGFRIVRYDGLKADTDTLRFFKIDQILARKIKWLVVTSYPDLPFGTIPKEIENLLLDTNKLSFETKFDPFYKERPKLVLDQQDAAYVPFAKFFEVQRPGPIITIYRIKF